MVSTATHGATTSTLTAGSATTSAIGIHPLIPTMLSELAFDREVGAPPPQSHNSLKKSRSDSKSFPSSWSGVFCLSFEDPDMFFDAQEQDYDVHRRSVDTVGTTRTSTDVSKLRGGSAGHNSIFCCSMPRDDATDIRYPSIVNNKNMSDHQRTTSNRAASTVSPLPPHFALQRNYHNTLHDSFHTSNDSLRHVSDRTIDSQSMSNPSNDRSMISSTMNATEEVYSPPVEVGPDGVIYHQRHPQTPPSIPQAQLATKRINSDTSPKALSTLPHHNPFARIQPPPPPRELPLRFLRAGKGDPVEGRRRYEATLAWRKEHGIDRILLDPHPNFELIKKHYPHYYHLTGRKGEPVFFEQPPKTNLQALRAGGIDLDQLVRHYTMVTEFQWQYIERDDLARSITVLDLEGIRMMDFVGDCVDYVKKCSHFTGQHYPERAGHVIVINVPKWFSMIWSVVKPMVDEVTLRKISIVRGKQEIYNALLEKIPEENIPPEYGGKSTMKLGESPQERALWDLISHNNALAKGDFSCGGRAANPPCPFCSWGPVRSY